MPLQSVKTRTMDLHMPSTHLLCLGYSTSAVGFASARARAILTRRRMIEMASGPVCIMRFEMSTYGANASSMRGRRGES